MCRKVRKIIRFKKYKDRKNEIYSVWFEDCPETEWDMTREEFELVQYENEMLKAGISSDMIVKHKSLVVTWIGSMI